MTREFDVLITNPKTGKQTDLNPVGTFPTLEKARECVFERLPGVKLTESGRAPAIDFYGEKHIRRAIILMYDVQ